MPTSVPQPVAVVDATGQQGGRVVDALLAALGDDTDLQAMFRWFARPPYRADLARPAGSCRT